MGEITKHKAWLCVCGRAQEHGLHYSETCSPVVKWSSVRLLLVLSVLHNWNSSAIDFDQAYAQADPDAPIYIYPPAITGFKTHKGAVY